MLFEIALTGKADSAGMGSGTRIFDPEPAGHPCQQGNRAPQELLLSSVLLMLNGRLLDLCVLYGASAIVMQFLLLALREVIEYRKNKYFY